MPVQMDEAKVMDRIALLLAKAERTDNEHEAQTFSDAAAALMVRYAVDEAAIEAAKRARGEESKPDPIEKREIPFEGGNAIVESTFRGLIVDAFGMRSVHGSRWKNHRKDNAYRLLTVIGHASEIDRAMTIAESLRQQATTAMAHWEATDRDVQVLSAMGKGQTIRSYRRSYLLAFAFEAAQRITDNRLKAEAEVTGTGTALVLADRGAALDAAVAQAFPNIRHQSLGVRDYAAQAGARDGRKARTGEHEVGGTRAIGGN